MATLAAVVGGAVVLLSKSGNGKRLPSRSGRYR
jgi:hypothetical protein